ncbi:reverse transcriptase domain-containing protein [Tanacetum coccineum]
MPAPDLRMMEELYQLTMNGRGGPIAPMNIQATNFGLKNHMIQQVQNSFQFHGLPGDDANKHLDKFLTITQRDGYEILSKYFPPYMVTKLRNDISNFRQLPDESLFEAWERYKLLIDQCPNHNMLPVTQIDTFYNGLILRHRDTINAAAGGTFMKRQPEECYDLIENMTAHHNDWDTSAHWGESSTTSSSSEIAALAQQMVKMRKDMLQVFRSNQSSKIPLSPCSLPYELPKRNPHQPLIPYPSRLNKEKLQDKSDIQVHKFLQMFMKLHFNISLVVALALTPKYAKMLKDLLSDKEKLLGLANTSLTENCSTILLKKLPKKLRDPRKFRIPCD